MICPPRITELVLKSGRHEKAIRLCLVPYFRSPQAYWPHTFFPSSVRYWLSILLLIQFQYFHYTPACTSCKKAHTATIYRIKPMILRRSPPPFSVSVKLTDFLHTFQIINYLSPQRWERMIFCPLSSILCSCGELCQSPIERPLTAITLLLIHF